jgi:hypothetical protein
VQPFSGGGHAQYNSVPLDGRGLGREWVPRDARPPHPGPPPRKGGGGKDCGAGANCGGPRRSTDAPGGDGAAARQRSESQPGLFTLARRASEGRTTFDCSLEIGQMGNLGRRSPSLARRASVFYRGMCGAKLLQLHSMRTRESDPKAECRVAATPAGVDARFDEHCPGVSLRSTPG